MVDKLKYGNLNIYKSIKTSPKKQKEKGDQSHLVNNNGKVKTKGKKDRQMHAQDKWKL